MTPSSPTSLVLLPGLDGTASLFTPFIDCLPAELTAVPVRYPADQPLGYSELLPFVQSATASLDSFVLLAESFSTPLALRFAAANPRGLRAIVLCAGFAESPLRGISRQLLLATCPILLRFPTPRALVRALLVGPAADVVLLSAVQQAIASVSTPVLVHRLRQVLTCDTTQDLVNLSVPLLDLRATNDRLISPHCARTIRSIAPQAATADIPGPHLLLQRCPRESADVVARFVQELPLDTLNR